MRIYWEFIIYLLHEWNCHLEVFSLPQAIDSSGNFCAGRRGFICDLGF